MAREITVPGIGNTTVPDDATDAEINYFVNKVQQAGSFSAAAEQAKQETPGRWGAGLDRFQAGIQSLLGKVAQDYAGAPKAARDLYEAAQANIIESRKYQPAVPSYRDIRGPGDLASYSADLLASSIPDIAVAGIGALGGELLGGPAGAVVGATLPTFTSMTGQNILAQAEEQGVPLEKTNLSQAALAAAPQTALQLVTPARFLNKIRLLPTSIRNTTVGKIAKEVAVSGAYEGLTEGAQQAIQVAQANPEKFFEFGPDVQNQILEAAIGGGLLGGIGGGTTTALQTPLNALYKNRAEARTVTNTVNQIRSRTPVGDLAIQPIEIQDPDGTKRTIHNVMDGTGRVFRGFDDPATAQKVIDRFNLQQKKAEELRQKAAEQKKRPEPGTPTPPEGAAPVEPPPSPSVFQRLLKIPVEQDRQNPITKTTERIKSETPIIDYAGRKIAVVNVDGVNVPFYQSSGLGGKAETTPGKWYPFFGIGADGWINKTSSKDMADYYGSPKLRQTAEQLDREVGDIRKRKDLPVMPATGLHAEFINAGLDPVENKPENADRLKNFIGTLVDRIERGPAPVEPPAPVAGPEPIVSPPEPPAAEPGAPPSGGVPFMMTANMRQRLAALGYSPEAIKNMTPTEAWGILTSQSPNEPVAPVGVSPVAPEPTPPAPEPTPVMGKKKGKKKAIPIATGPVVPGAPISVGEADKFRTTDAEAKKMMTAFKKEGWSTWVSDPTSSGAPAWLGDIQNLIDELSLSFGIKQIPKLYAAKPKPSSSGNRGHAFAYKGGGSPVILIHNGLDRNAAVAVALHELGHHVDYSLLQNAPIDVQNAIEADFKKSLGNLRTPVLASAIKPLTAARVGDEAYYNKDIDSLSKSDRNYLISKSEWFAEQVSRFLTQREEPKNAVERFFKGIADVWNKIYNTLTQFVPLSNSVEDFLKGQWRPDLIQQRLGQKPVKAPTKKLGKSDIISGASEEETALEDKFSFDNPAISRGNTEWLRQKQAFAEEDMAKYAPSTASGKGLSGPTTARTKNPIQLETQFLSSIKGANDEVRSSGDVQFENLAKDVEKKGWTPDPIMIVVNHKGDAFIYEGNTRVAIAAKNGIKSVPAEIHWVNGGELADNGFSPNDFLEHEVYSEYDLQNIASAPTSVRQDNPPTKSEYEVEVLSPSNENPGPAAPAPNFPYLPKVVQATPEAYKASQGHMVYGAAAYRLANFLDKIFQHKWTQRFLPNKLSGEKVADAFMIAMTDKMLPVGKVVDYIRAAGGTVLDAFDPYLREEQMYGVVNERLTEAEANLYKPVTDAIKRNGLSIDDVNNYLYALHAPERNKVMREIGNTDPERGSGMGDKEAADIIKAVKGSPKYAAYEEVRGLVRKIINDTNKTRIDAGLIPEKMPPRIVTKPNGDRVEIPEWTNYVPLRGFADEAIEAGSEAYANTGKGLKIRGKEDKSALGRTSKASDIMTHVMLQHTEAVIRAEKNKVGRAFYDLIQNNMFLPKEGFDVRRDYGIEILKSAPMKMVLNRSGVLQFVPDAMFKSRDDVFVFKMDGKEVAIKIGDPALRRALIDKPFSGPESVGKVIRLFGSLNRWLARVNTGVNPEFMLTNLPRDLEQALISIGQYDIKGIEKEVFSNVRKALAGSYRVIRDQNAKGEWEDIFRDFAANGGMTSGIAGIRDFETRIKKIGELVKDDPKTAQARAWEASKAVIGWLEDVNSAFENSIRLSVYQSLVKKGLTKARAAQAAKNLTVNFDKKGQYGQYVNSFYLFFNASVQGMLSMANAMSRSKRVQRRVAGLVMLGFMQDILNSLFGQDDSDGENFYDKIPDYKLERNLIVMVPGTKEYVAIPLPPGFSFFFNTGRLFSRKLRQKDSTSDTVKGLIKSFIDNANPLGGTETFLNFLAPTAMDPVVSLTANIDFTGRKIVPTDFPGAVPRPNSQMYWSSTNSLFTKPADWLSKMTGGTDYVPGLIEIKPGHIEYWADFLGGGAAAFVKRSYGAVTGEIPKLLRGDLENIDLNNVPVVRRVVGTVSERIQTEDYMEKVNHVLQRGMEFEAAKKEGDFKSAQAAQKNYAGELRIYNQVKQLNNKRARLASDLKKLRANPKISPEQMLLRSEQIQKQMRAVMEQVNILYGKNVKENTLGLF